MRSYTSTKSVSTQIKASLQVCHKSINREKYSEREYRLFSSLAEVYLQKGNIREYSKAVAIYQYLKKLVEKHLKGDKEKLVLIDQRIRAVEVSFLRKVRELKPDIKSREQYKSEEQDITDINIYKKELEKFREVIKKELAAIEDLGIEKDKEELNEGGLQKRAQEVEKIYMGIREFFIGKRNEAGELAQQGLLNKLINDCIKQLGGLPRVGKDKHEVEYAVFGMGSMALGTMTLWSDIEFGILVEERLGKDEEERVKEYFRNLTTLLHIKVVNFGETPLRLLDIAELNNFKLKLVDASDSEHDWFRDNLTTSGFSFDGPHWHACKTALGRASGHKKTVVRGDIQEIIPCLGYELIGTVRELLKFYREEIWSREDPHLVQALGHTILIEGSQVLLGRYRERSEEYRGVTEANSFKILKENSKEFDPFKQISYAEKEGHILNVKKEIYRFPDRMIVALGDCLGGKGISSWELIRNAEKVENKQRQDLQVALSIATELRLRTYANNNGQREDLSALARYESQIKELRNEVLTEEVFYLKDIRMLYRYYHIVAELGLRINNVKDKQSLVEINEILITKTKSVLIRGYTYKRFLKYYDAIKEFELLERDDITMNILAKLYYEVGRYEDSLKYYQEGLKMRRRIYKGDHTDIAASLNNIGHTLERLGRYEDTLKYYQEGLEMRRRIYKRGHADIAASLNNIGNALERLGRYGEALKCQQEGLEMRRRIYKGDHAVIATFLNNIGATLERLGRYEDALKCQQESLEIRRRIYKGDHTDIAASLNNIGHTLERLGKYEEALTYYQESLEMRKRIFKGDHTDIADSLSNIGNALQKLGRYEEALTYYQESLEMRGRIYKGDHADIATSLNNIGIILESLGRYEDALKYKQESLEVRRKVYKGNHADIAASLNNIGSTLESLGRYESALKYQQESLEMRRKVYKDDHIDIAASLNNIGSTLESLGRYEDALTYNQESLEMMRRIYKNDHTDIAASLNNIGITLENLGRYEEALKYKQESLEMRQKIYKGDHTDIAASLSNIGNTLQSLGRFGEALKSKQEGLDMMRRIYKGDHIDIAASLNNTGITLESLGRYEDALKYYRESLEMKKRIYKGDHASITTSLNNIGNTLESLGRYEDALKYYQESLEMKSRIYEGDHASIAASLNNIGITLESLGRHVDALKCKQESLEMRRRIYKGDHTDIAASLNDIGSTLESLGRYEEALKYHQASLEMRRKIYKDAHADIAASLNNIGSTLSSLKRLDEALKYYQESLEMKRRIYKDDHVSIAASLNNIGITLQSLGRFDEALQCALQSRNMFQKVLYPEHPHIQMAQRQFLNCTVLLANQEILSGDLDKALKYYKTIIISFEIEDLRKVISSFASQFWQMNELNLTISCYEALSERLVSQDKSIKHNLACMYHVKALKEQDNEDKFIEYLSKARTAFEMAINLKPEEASTYVEYSQFLLRHHDTQDESEYSAITVNAMSAIALKDDGSGLSYAQMERFTTVTPIQWLLSRQDEVAVKPHILAHYLLIKVHLMHNNKKQAEEALRDLRTEIQSLQDPKDIELAQYLDDWSSRELKSHNLQQVVMANVVVCLQSGINAMIGGRDITASVLAQSLLYDHIGIIWEYYSEQGVMCMFKHQLRQIFNSILSSSSEVLRMALSKNDSHIGIIMGYLDEEMALYENFEMRVIAARNENKAVMKELSMSI